MVNAVTLIGRVGSVSELKHTSKSGTAKLRFRLATTEHFRRKEAKEQVTTWHSCEVFGASALNASSLLKAGQLLYVLGRIENKNWEDDAGAKHFSSSVVVRRFQLLSPKEAEVLEADVVEEEAE
jgi:single-strand DNA-binding protein